MERLTWPGPDETRLLERARRWRDGPARSILGLAGAPAAGKSTLAATVVTELDAERPGSVVLVGMDAFHLGHRVLERRGLAGVKGAPHTFDVLGYLALLRRIRVTGETVYAPEFRREIEDSLAHVVEIGPEVSLVVTEGNYLLLGSDPWSAVRELLDESWFLHLPDDVRQRRMLARHESFGHDPEWARRQTYGNDEPNAALVNRSSTAPDVWIEHRG